MQVLDSVDTNGHQEEHQNELSVGQRAAHEIEYPFIQEFSELLSDLSTKELLKLLTNQQKNLAKAFWEAENYGGCREKCKKRLAEIHGNDWMKAVKFREHFHPIEDYYIYVLLIDHKRQWDKHKKIAMLNQANDPE